MVRIDRDVLDTTICDNVCQGLVAGQWISPDLPFSFTYKTYHDRQDITVKLLKVEFEHHNPNQTNRKSIVSIVEGVGI